MRHARSAVLQESSQEKREFFLENAGIFELGPRTPFGPQLFERQAILKLTYLFAA
jgi:hypothetical protein